MSRPVFHSGFADEINLYLATKIKHIAKKLNLDNKCFQQL